MKRVCTLYRVSTKGQVDVTKDDIPMQRIACREFAEDHGWQIVIEKIEKGVSGSKVSATKRDAIQDIKEAATRKEFDVLLVFMFDRLGRIDSETPFVLEWFTKHGIEVWSVKEGEQRMDSHTDKLINYIRFWQAAGESEKLSIRVKTRIGQMISEGIYTGGVVPLGYKLEYKGRLNKKGQPVRDIVVDPGEAETVKELFSKVVNEGYGSFQLAELINKKGIRTKNGSRFQAAGILRILKNEIYCGYLVRGDNRSERLLELQIISDSVFARTQDILKQRYYKNEEKRKVALNNLGRNLLGGNLYCAHCGSRLSCGRRLYKYVRSDGTEINRDQALYVCYRRNNGLIKCEGSCTYLANKIDNKAREKLYDLFTDIRVIPEREAVSKAFKCTMEKTVKRRKFLAEEVNKCKNDMSLLYSALPCAIDGSSGFEPSDITAAFDYTKGRLSFIEKEYEKTKKIEDDKDKTAEKINEAYDLVLTWSEQFDYINHNGQKMILSNMFERIEIGKGYNVKMIMSEEYRYFFNERNWEIIL